jgi:hypothetical protein
MNAAEPETAEAMAAALLDTVGIPSAPGLDIFDLARRAGVPVHRRSLAIDGQVERLDGALCVSLSHRAPIQRQRFTLAHELGHVLLEDRDVADAVGHQASGSLDIERFCNEFAAELLMPRAWVQSYRRKRQNFETLNAFVGEAEVSNTAAVVRLSRHAAWSVVLLFFDRQRSWGLTTLAGAPRWAKGAIEPLPDTTRLVQAIDREDTAGEARVINLRTRQRLLVARAEFQPAERGVLALAVFQRRRRHGTHAA